MAERNFDTPECLGRKKRFIMGSFAPDTANPPTALKGSGFTVAYTSTGTYTVTFANSYGDLVSATATLQLASADDKFAQVGTYTAADRTLVLRVLDASGAAVAEVAADANNRVNFLCVFDDSLTV